MIDCQLQNLQPPPIHAVGVPHIIHRIQTRSAGGITRRPVDPSFQKRKPTPVELGEGAGEWGCDRAHQIVYGARRLPPIDAAVLGPAPAEIRALR